MSRARLSRHRRRCLWCDEIFDPWSVDGLFCSRAHAALAHRVAVKEWHTRTRLLQQPIPPELMPVAQQSAEATKPRRPAVSIEQIIREHYAARARQEKVVIPDVIDDEDLPVAEGAFA